MPASRVPGLALALVLVIGALPGGSALAGPESDAASAGIDPPEPLLACERAIPPAMRAGRLRGPGCLDPSLRSTSGRERRAEHGTLDVVALGVQRIKEARASGVSTVGMASALCGMDDDGRTSSWCTDPSLWGGAEVADATPPAHENFANRAIIGVPHSETTATTEATTEPGGQQPSCGSAVGKTVWYQYTAEEDRTLRIRTAGSDFDTVVSIWTGSALGGLTEHACNDDAPTSLTSEIHFTAPGDTTYLIQVGGYEGDAGSLVFDVDLGPDTPGSIIGTVTDEATGDPLSQMCVDARDAATFASAGRAYTDTSGMYVLDAVPAGTYKVWISDCYWPYEYLSEWYEDRTSFQSADAVTVEGSDAVVVDAALEHGGSITGTVTDEETSEPLSMICVDVHDSANGVYRGSGTTDASGAYRVDGLPTGAHDVKFFDCGWSGASYVTEWYDDRLHQWTADAISVTAPDTISGIDAALALGGSISGTVVDADTEAPLERICVSAYDHSAERWVGSGFTNASGSYRVGVLPSGSYVLSFRDCSWPARYLGEWYDDAAGMDSADPLIVSAGSDLEGVDVGLSPGGTITGTVRDEASGDPLSEICIDVFDAVDREWVGEGYTNAEGGYSTGPLPTGAYKMSFFDCGWPREHLSEWHQDGSDFASATPVDVTAPDEVAVDAGLARGATISGTVTDEATHEPVSDICVGAYDATGETWLGGDYTGSSGTYLIPGLPSGAHLVEFEDCDWPVRYLTEWYDDRQGLEEANGVVVTAPEVVQGIDAGLTRGGTISGRVTDQVTGAPIPWACAVAFDPSGADWVAWGFTDEAGDYETGAVPSGAVRVLFYDCDWPLRGYAFEWYRDGTTLEDAAPVLVATGVTTSGIDGSLAAGGAISGVVSDDVTGDPVADVCVSVHEAGSGVIVEWGYTGESGAYTTGALPSGSFKLAFEDCEWPLRYEGEWFDDQPDLASGNPVSVSAPLTTTGIDAGLGLGRHLLVVARSGSGAGSVHSSPSGIACGVDCDHRFTEGRQVTLTALPDPGSTFVGWAGDCSGIGSCESTMDTARAVTATFEALSPDMSPPPISPLCGQPGVICGTVGSDVILGTSGPDVIIGGPGDDVCKGLGGDDVIFCGPGDDRIVGGKGNDRLRSTSGRDVILGKAGNDVLRGGGGRDRLDGGPGRDRCVGGPGRDRLRRCER